LPQWRSEVFNEKDSRFVSDRDKSFCLGQTGGHSFTQLADDGGIQNLVYGVTNALRA
jgi:hypothetical protein